MTLIRLSGESSEVGEPTAAARGRRRAAAAAVLGRLAAAGPEVCGRAAEDARGLL